MSERVAKLAALFLCGIGTRRENVRFSTGDARAANKLSSTHPPPDFTTYKNAILMGPCVHQQAWLRRLDRGLQDVVLRMATVLPLSCAVMTMLWPRASSPR